MTPRATGGLIPPDVTLPQRLRRPTRLLAGLIVAVGLGSLPVASAAELDPSDPSAPGTADPFDYITSVPPRTPGGTATPCSAKANFPFPIKRPADFKDPEGLPDVFRCGQTYFGGNTFAFAPQYAGAATLGLQGSPHLAQWVKLPVIYAAAVVPVDTVTGYTTAPPHEPADTRTISDYYGSVYFLSKDKRSVGRVPAFRVRTLAFGAIPVEVTVSIQQPKDRDGVVEPIKVHGPVSIIGPRGAEQVIRDAFGEGKVELRLSDVHVDGQSVGVGDRCRTADLGALRVFGEGYRMEPGDRAGSVPDGKYNVGSGGILHGTLDVSRFVDCRSASGDDISPLLTNAVSGKGNPLTIAQTNGGVPYCYPLTDDSYGFPPPKAPYDTYEDQCLSFLPKLPTIPGEKPSPTTVEQEPQRFPRQLP